MPIEPIQTMPSNVQRRIARVEQTIDAQRRARTGRGLLKRNQRTASSIDLVPLRNLAFLGRLTPGGPNGESDYDDERYWVIKAVCTNKGGGVDSGQFPVELKRIGDAEDPDLGPWVTATNIAELDPSGVPGQGTHDLDMDTYVWIRPIMSLTDADGIAIDGWNSLSADDRRARTAKRMWWFNASVAKPAPAAAIMVQITAYTSIAPNRWTYTARRVNPLDGGQWEMTIDIVDNIYNTLEANNTADGIQGNGINLSTLPVGFSMQPIPPGAVVPITADEVEVVGGGTVTQYKFTVPNAVDGTCV